MGTRNHATQARDAVRRALRATMVMRELADGSCHGRFGRPGDDDSIIVMIGPRTTEAEVRDWLRWVAWALEGAHDFSLEDTPNEVDEEGRNVTPATTDDESTFFNAGLVAMPFPKVTFSYRQRDGNDALLVAVADRPDDPTSGVRTVEIFRTAGLGLWTYALSTQLARTGGPEEAAAWSRGVGLTEGQRARLDAGESLGAVMTSIHLKSLIDPFGIGPATLRLLARQGPVEPNDLVRDADMLVYLLVMLGSTSTELRRVEPGKNANRLRVRKGLPAEAGVTTVRLVPREIAEDMRAGGDEAAAWRRIHWRRSHARHLASGRTVVVCRHVVGYRRLDGTELAANGYVMTKRLSERAATRSRGEAANPARTIARDPGPEPAMRGRVDVEALRAEVAANAASPVREAGNAAFRGALSRILDRR